MEDDKLIQLGLGEVLRAGSGDHKVSDHSEAATSPDSASLDPYEQLANAGQWGKLREVTEPIVEAAGVQDLSPAQSIHPEKIWWLRASVELGIPEPFLLGSLSEIASHTVARDSALGLLIQNQISPFQHAGATILSGECQRILGGDSHTADAAAPVFDPGVPANKYNNRLLQRKSGNSFNLLILMLISGAVLIAIFGWFFYRIQARAKQGQIANGNLTLGTRADPPLSAMAPPPLAPVAAPSILDRVLVALEEKDRSKPLTVSGQSSAASVDASRASQTASTASQPSAINWDGPIETEEVRQALEKGDPDPVDDTAHRLFGDPQPQDRGSNVRDGPFGSESPSQARSFGRLREYRAIVRTIVSREPKFTSRKITEILPDATVFVDQEDGPFLRVRLPSGGNGYVLSQDLEEVK